MSPDAVDMWINGRPVVVDFAHEMNGRIHFETEKGDDYSFNAETLQKIIKFVHRRDRKRMRSRKAPTVTHFANGDPEEPR